MLDQLRHEEGEVRFNAAKPNFPPHPSFNLLFLLSFVPGLHSQPHYTRVQINSTTTFEVSVDSGPAWRNLSL